MEPRAVILAGLLLGWMGSLLLLGLVGSVRADDELERHLADLRQQIDDPTTNIGRREVLVLEIAATLDRTGQAAPAFESRRTRWTEAIQLLDRFETQNPRHPRARETQFQAAVYLWARGRSWQQEAALDPANQAARSEAIKDLDAAFVRLRAVHEVLQPGDGELLAQNVRYRIARTLADRAELDPDGSPGQKRFEDDALASLDRVITEPSLRGFAQLLRADLLSRQERFDQAEQALSSAVKTKPAPPPGDLLEVRVEILAGRKRFDEAIAAIDAAAIDAAAKDALAVRLLLSQRAGTASATERSAAESGLFRRVAALRASSAPGARAVLLELARRLVEPDAAQGPEAWEAVAEGALGLGELMRASRLESRAAARAEALGRMADAAKLRLRAGAYLYQAEQYGEADRVLTQVFDDPKAGPARSGAGMLRALTRGRALALGRPGATMKGYVDALDAQIRQFPHDTGTNEARWLLGKLRFASSDKDAAMALWSTITPGTPRWVDARLAIARNHQRDVDILSIGNDRAQIDARYQQARTFLTESLELAPSADEKAELTLALARLELTPVVGAPERAAQHCEQLLHSSTGPDLRERVRRLKIVALAELNRFDEAETRAREESGRSLVVELLETARLLDHVVSDSESDLRIRRFGLIIRTLLAREPETAKELSEEQLAELRLRRCRALLFRGDDEGARRSLTAWNGRVPEDDHGFLKDLGDTYFRLQAYVLAIDVERLRQQRLPSGSLPWFESRYRLALAEHWAGKNKDALHLIDATSILHPDLGGGELREKFIRLRQKMGPDP